MTIEATTTNHCVEDVKMSAEQAITMFYQNFPIVRGVNVHDDFVQYGFESESSSKWYLNTANDTITMFALPLTAEVKRLGMKYQLTVTYKR